MNNIADELDARFAKTGTYPVDIYSIITNEEGEYDGEGIHYFDNNGWAYEKDNDYFQTRFRKAFEGDSRQFSGTDASRFGERGRSYGNISTGYDVGRELVPWWDAFSQGTRPDKKQAIMRGILAGNFVYLPCDEARNPIPFSKAKTTPVKHYCLVLFYRPTMLGLDVWTPTGDPDMPIKLEKDGKPDGVVWVVKDGLEGESYRKR